MHISFYRRYFGVTNKINKMKSLLLTATIFVTTHGKQIKLTNDQYKSLQSYSTNNVKNTLSGCDKGCNIRNNEAADQIFKFLGK